MQGIQFVTDDKGKAVAVQIDLRKYARAWEDFYDVLIAEQRSKEPHVPWEEVKKRLSAARARKKK